MDINSLSPKIYKEYTGGELKQPLSNLEKLLSIIGQEKIVIRVHQIPEMAGKSEQDKTCEKLREIGIKCINRFRYKMIKKN